MTMYIFDENNVEFRCPIGALEAPGKLSLTIKIRQGDAVNPRVCIYPDGGDQSEMIMVFDHVTGVFDVYKCELDIEKAGLYWYYFNIESSHGGSFTVPEQPGGAFQITAFNQSKKTPDWLYGGMIYHIFVDRFARGADPKNEGKSKVRPGAVQRPDWGGCPYFLPDERGIVRNNDFFGGDLYGIIEKLPYLEEMGVACIYLSPVFEAASNHKYDTGDFLKVDSAFGGNAALERLCSEAESRGIKIILDGVFNHVGCDSRYFNRYGKYEDLGAFQSEKSKYRSWFNFQEDGKYLSWWDIELLPAVNEQEKSYIDFICGKNGVVEHWMKKGVYGWRLDVVDELPDAFLDPLCATIKKVNPKALIVGEVWEDASHKIAYGVRRRYFLGGQLDSVTNYPLKNAIIACVKEKNVMYLVNTIAVLCRNYPANVLNSLMNILGTHDTMRVLTALSDADFPESKLAMSKFRLSDAELVVAKKRLKQAAALQFTLPGVPCVYYGDEAGMDGGADPFNRRCYPWGKEDPDLVAWYKKLAGLRKKHKCFKEGKYELVEARLGLFAFTRGEGATRVLTAVNVSDEDRILEVGKFNYDLLNEEYTDVLTVKPGEAAMFSIRTERSRVDESK